MLLTLDIGNTMAKFVFFNDDQTIYSRYLTKTRPERSFDEYKSFLLSFIQTNKLDIKIEDAIISSVVPSLTPVFLEVIKEVFGVNAKTLGPGLKSGVAIKTDNPKEVGADLVGDAIGAKLLYGGDVIIADLGTANKVILLDGKGDFVGCSIAPGLGLGLSALVSNTAALTDVSLQIPPKIIGKNTPDSMNSGLLYGTSFAISKMAEEVEKEVGHPCKKVLTGGYSSYVNRLLPEFEYEPDLLAVGLYSLLINSRGK